MPFQEEVKKVIEKLLALMGVPGSVAIEERDGRLVFNVKSENSSLLIGQHGAHLAALQHMVRLLVKSPGDDISKTPHFVIDIGNYRKEREDFLEELAKQAADRVIQTKQKLVLKPMSSYERFFIHSHLAKYENLITESEGEEPERRIVIRPKG